MQKKKITETSLASLYSWFEQLCKYNDDEGPRDRLYAEGMIYACREAVGDFEYRYKQMSRGTVMLNNEWFLKGYQLFKEEYDTENVEFKKV
jgi:hypothetical protein